MRRRHSWSDEKVVGNLVASKRCATCKRCGAFRERHDDGGTFRLIYREASPYCEWRFSAPVCENTA